MNSIYTELVQRAKELEKLVEVLEMCLKKAPKGTLRISNKNGNLQFYHRENKSDRYGKYLGAEDGLLIAQLRKKAMMSRN